MATAKNFSELKKMIEEKVKKSLQNEVFEEVRDVYQKNIDDAIYDSYSTTIYERRDINDGLIADDNIVGNVDNLTLEVKNIAEESPSILDKHTSVPFTNWIEEGRVPNIFNDKDYPWMHERPFTQYTIDDLKSTKKHVKALKDSLKKQGLDVK